MGSLSTHSRLQAWTGCDATANFDTLRPVSNAWAQVPPTMLVPKVAYLGGDTRFGAWSFARALWRTLSYLGRNYNFYPHGEDRACGAKLLCNCLIVWSSWLIAQTPRPNSRVSAFFQNEFRSALCFGESLM